MEAIETSGENVDDKVTTPASSNIFKVSEQEKQLEEENSEIFHSAVAKKL